MHKHAFPFVLIGTLAACGGNTTVDSFDSDGGGGSAGGGAGSTTTSTTTTTTTGSGGGAGLASCDGPGQCVLASETCCGVCGMPTLDDMVPLHRDNLEQHIAEACADPVPCPDCPVAPNPDLYAFCEGTQCVGADMGSHPANQCTYSTDCRLRWGLGCCECGSEGMGLTAVPVSFVSELEALVCTPSTGCPQCMPQYPFDAEAICDVGRCVVVWLNTPSGS